MKDRFGREINYIRISVTDRCNFRCVYCMPPEGIACVPMAEILTFEEIRDFCREAAKLGISRIKLTGGEPLVRRDVPVLVGMLHEIPGIRQVTLTTNGALLEKHLDALLDHHLDAVNVSLDTADPARFSEMTRGGRLEDVLSGMEAAVRSGIPVKLNTVLYPGEEWKEMVRFAKDRPLDVRFIEMMPIGKGRDYAGVSGHEVLRYLESRYGEVRKDDRVHGNGPAEYYTVPGFSGSIGLIAPVHGTICGRCSRIRLGAAGQLKSCLCDGKTVDVKDALRSGDFESVRRIIKEVIADKPYAHRFAEAGGITEKRMMAGIGG